MPVKPLTSPTIRRNLAWIVVSIIVLMAAFELLCVAALVAHADTVATSGCGALGLPPCVITATSPPVMAAATPTANAWTAAFNNLLTVVLTAAVTVIGGVVIAAGSKLASKWNLQGVAQDLTNNEAHYIASLNAAITKFLPLIQKNGWDSPIVRDTILADASAYFQQRFPDHTAQIAKSAQTSDRRDTSDAVKQTLAARLPDAITAAAASPATPPATPVVPRPLDPVPAATKGLPA